MTTPPTPAGWYPDPDGTGGQRYWDGAAWTEHQAPPAAPAPPPAPTQEPRSWPSELPPWPSDMEMPSWEKAASEQPTSVVRVSPSEPQAAEPATEPESEPESEAPAPAPSALEQETAVVKLPEQPAEQPTEQPTTAYPTYTPPPAEPTPGWGEPQASSFAEPFRPAAAPTGNGNLVKGYLGGVGVLLIALIATLVYALVIHKPDTSQLSLPGASTSESSSSSAETATEKSTPSETDSPSPTATPSGGEAVDGDVTFAQNGIEIGPTVTAADNDLLSKTATGEFVVVHLTLTNSGESPATFIADQQILTADGQTYTPDTEATFYLGGTSTVVYPDEPVEVSIAYDVPPGSVPQSLQVHGDISSAGAVLDLS